jgi:UDP-N-acetyl-2-amino-2-deoxyglucuronate dehydrogenase
LNFVIIGVGGYIAPKHLEAIKAIDGNLLAAVDVHDSVGVLDSYFPMCNFFTEFERFDRHCEKLMRSNTPVNYVVVCSPNYLHDAHIRFGLRLGADVICEKPLTLNPHNLKALMLLEKETNHKIHPILQLRWHPQVIELKRLIEQNEADNDTINLNYVTPRGNWYEYSWKGQIPKSGGIVTNIGIHCFDVLIHLYGGVEELVQFSISNKMAKGILKLQQATVNWFLSIDYNDLPSAQKKHRVLEAKQFTIDFTEGFDRLHITSYQKIITNQGFSTADALPAIDLVSKLR